MRTVAHFPSLKSYDFSYNNGMISLHDPDGLLEGTGCLDPAERLSPGQAEEITRVHAAYPTLNDDAFVAEHLGEWMK